MDLSSEELRVVGCLIEKQVTTPQYYPLTLNALVNACNQSSNRDPVVQYDADLVERTLERLRERGLVRFVYSSHGSRVTKYRQVVDEQWELEDRERGLLCLLMLRGPQTPGELRARSGRLADFSGLDDVEDALSRLSTREPPLVERLERQPGQKEARYRQLAGESGTREPTARADGHAQVSEWIDPGVPRVDATAEPGVLTELRAEIEALRVEVEDLRAEVEDLRARLDAALGP